MICPLCVTTFLVANAPIIASSTGLAISGIIMTKLNNQQTPSNRHERDMPMNKKNPSMPPPHRRGNPHIVTSYDSDDEFY